MNDRDAGASHDGAPDDGLAMAAVSAVDVQAALPRWTQRLTQLVQRGGPGPQDYGDLLHTMQVIHQARRSGALGQDQLDELRQLAGPAMGPGTLQGRAWLKAHGYAGDFQMIDDIYTGACSDEPGLRAWDLFYQRLPSVQAVRNRKTFFKRLLQQRVRSRGGERVDVLNVASGPCRDVAEFLDEHPGAPVHFVCIDMDERAIAHAQALCAPWPEQVQFVRRNALRLRLSQRFDLVWSAGLFDYFDDDGFVVLAQRLLDHAHPGGGSLVVGNFSDDNPTLAYQAWTDWHLHHRSRERLLCLGEQCRPAPARVSVDAEPLGINLFLRLDR